VTGSISFSGMAMLASLAIRTAALSFAAGRAHFGVEGAAAYAS
jgi:hypothetical protein